MRTGEEGGMTHRLLLVITLCRRQGACPPFKSAQNDVIGVRAGTGPLGVRVN